ncbi:hypothetical protein AAFF_G00065500 [Aldrovandia affinis]|uniref:PLAC domain-containing protein n=1 Tax=Aldrovandia affinis TaxID=143900 RepID=A0AAD7WYK4_9TELE|nr:hypothetical protein AAFF_G00065500 [Aldrovandia affinis]
MDQCTSCKSGFHLNEVTNGCVSSCGEGSYLEHDGNVCRKCGENCRKCTSSTICSECKPGMTLQGNKCLMSCDAGSYYNGHRRTCEPCHRACATCAGTGMEACNKCAESYYMEEWKCVQSCSAGFYLAEQTSDSGEPQKICKKCDASCYSCSGPGERNCSTCVSGYNLEAGVCVVSTICKDANEESWAEGSFCVLVKKNNLCQRKVLQQLCCRTCSLKGNTVNYGAGKQFCPSDPRKLKEMSQEIFIRELRFSAGSFKIPKSSRTRGTSTFGSRKLGEMDRRSGAYRSANRPAQQAPVREYLTEQDRCHLCDATCYKCTGPENTDCISCGLTRYFDGGRCAFQCSLGKYALDGQCHLCHHTCEDCDDGGPDNCTSCDQDKFKVDRYLFQGQCRDACPEAHYHSREKTCAPCGENCNLCTSGHTCLRCAASYYPKDGVCVRLDCGEGEVEDPDYEDCLPCEEGCKKCFSVNPEHCISCREGFYKYDLKCYKTCPDKMYSFSTDMSCEPCDDNCVSCDDSQCYWCEDGLFLSDDKCVKECVEGFYGDEESQECEPCHSECRTCGGPNYDDCDTCEEGVTLVEGKCVVVRKTCPENSFLTDANVCAECHPSCKSCSGAGKNQCNTCERDWFLAARQTCLKKCPEGSFGNMTTGRCEDCLAGCVQCEDGVQCQKCLSGRKNQLYLEAGRCVSHCYRGFPEEGVCQSCAPLCASCERNATRCLSCVEPAVQLAHECRESCPPAHFSREGQCHRCPSACRDCTQDGLCKECENYYFLHEDRCLDDCPSGFYTDLERQECVRCRSACATCDGPDEDDCDSCTDERAVRYNGECLPKCPSNTYTDTYTMECRDCDRSCLTCSGPHVAACLTCREDMRKDIHGHCIFQTECSLRSYKDQQGECQPCHRLCHRCTGPSRAHCMSCNDQYFLLNHTCVAECPLGFYGDREQKLCERCHFTCESCRGRHSIECLTCKAHLLKLGRGCVETCGSSHYANMSSRTCERCDPSCGDCTGGGEAHCLTCRDRYFHLRTNGRCYATCPDNHYEDARTGTCERCHPTCKTCTDEGALACQSCYMGYRFLHGICESECMIGQYATAVTPSLKCESCDGSCVDCKGPGPHSCTVCPALDLLSNDGRCLTCCGEESRKDSAPMPQECCNCTESREECVPGVNFSFRGVEELAGRPVLFIITSILLILSLGGAVFLFLHFRSKDKPKVKASGYEKLGNSGGAKGSASFEPGYSGGSAHFRESQLVDYQDRAEDEEDEDEEDEDIVYMGQDGTVYRKFKYGLLEEDEEEEMEYDDESYSFR